MADMTVRDFYTGKNIFITGGSGFLGICLLEKILRCIPDIGDIYLLLRPKKGKEIADRLQEIKKNRIFEQLLENKSEEEVCSPAYILIIYANNLILKGLQEIKSYSGRCGVSRFRHVSGR